MTPPEDDSREERVLVLTPTGADARVACEILRRAGLAAELCRDLRDLLTRLATGAGCIFIAQEALTDDSLDRFSDALRAQEPWSDIPIVLLSTQRLAAEVDTGRLRPLSEIGNILIVERPCRAGTLISVTRMAMRARRRQYTTRKLLDDRAKARDVAEQANLAKDRFLATLSHELRTPLTPVLATAGILLQDPSLPPGVHADLEVIQRNVELEARLIDDLLDLTRVSKGKLQLNRETIDVHQLIRRVYDICCAEVQNKHLQVEFHLDAPQHFVYADAARLHQMIWNLLKNAAKFTPERGQITLSTTNSAATLEPHAEPLINIEVRDNGIGIPREQLPHLFHAFEQGGGDITRQFGGLGLGLAITRALADAHRGCVTAQSEGAGKGSTFTLSLAAVAPSLPVSTEPVNPEHGPARSLSVLLIEDHPDTSRVMARVLASWGHCVIPAHSVAEACQLARREKIDLVISDIGLPDGTGIEFIEALRAHSDVPAIALSGFGMEEDVKRCFAAGFQTHLTKPVSFAKLASAINELIDAGDVNRQRRESAGRGGGQLPPSDAVPPHPAHTGSHV